MKLINFLGLFALLVLLLFAVAATVYIAAGRVVAQDVVPEFRDAKESVAESEFDESAREPEPLRPELPVDPESIRPSKTNEAFPAFESQPSSNAAEETQYDAPTLELPAQQPREFRTPRVDGPGPGSTPIGLSGPPKSGSYRLERVPVFRQKVINGRIVMEQAMEERWVQTAGPNSKTQSAIQKLSNAKSEKDKKKSEQELRAALDTEYEAFLKQHEARLAKVEAQLKSLQKELDRRRKAKPELLELRIKTIINNINGLGWPGDQLPQTSQFPQPQDRRPGDPYKKNVNEEWPLNNRNRENPRSNLPGSDASDPTSRPTNRDNGLLEPLDEPIDETDSDDLRKDNITPPEGFNSNPNENSLDLDDSPNGFPAFEDKTELPSDLGR